MLRVTGILVALATALSLSAMAPAVAKDVKVGVVVKIGGIPWFNAMEAGIKAQSQELGDDGFMVGPTSADPALQVRAIEDLIAQGVNVIGVVPNDANVLEPVLKKARDAGIKVITHESPDQKNADWDFEMVSAQGFGEAHAKLLAREDGRQGQVRRLCRLADGAAAQCLGRLRDRLSQEELSRTCRWSATATALPKVPTTAARRRSTCWRPIPISAAS